jgi:hypothetical protein
MTLTLEPKAAHGSPDWLAARHRDDQGRARLTASVAGVLFGTHPFITPADLAVQMLKDEAPDEQTTAAMERGTALEPALVDYWAAKHFVPVACPEVMHVNERWVANLDGETPERPLEAKTSATLRWRGELPDHWRWQGVAQRHCFADAPGAVEWVILDADLRIQFHTQTVTADELHALRMAGADWLSYIDIGMPPAGVSLAAKHVASLNPGGAGQIELPADASRWVRQLQQARAMAKMAKLDEDEAKDALARALGGADEGTVDGQTVVTWREQSGRAGFDKAGFAADYPALLEKYTTVGKPFRVMRPKGDVE